ncbi:uncharacterized protein SPPG_04555 [Spizellomyces punctatus DAOM BR117]|uniref:F-box domain-containing protein n=1 Tax=Spizellomyces punctatus (strain DAOM BR117) TaxID=645134 RepID=A0A0L0HH63_SPIPD|nr:uncharacterized protein SPPG_04555 [Spizellomyces punctatus DAOM BR117]KND00220.1 hypothetical protein SPPG_04555 [Spizellomyces punctatus DAOM BR117]|eukprot:XP_016608259.1 hypothetical protein SPPG_04555 [Spizellomyces punctatus DAOM BR117]
MDASGSSPSPQTCTMDPFLYLPVELALRCLSFVDTTSLPAVTRVCKRWHQIVESDALWRERCFISSTIVADRPLRWVLPPEDCIDAMETTLSSTFPNPNRDSLAVPTASRRSRSPDVLGLSSTASDTGSSQFPSLSPRREVSRQSVDHIVRKLPSLPDGRERYERLRPPPVIYSPSPAHPGTSGLPYVLHDGDAKDLVSPMSPASPSSFTLPKSQDLRMPENAKKVRFTELIHDPKQFFREIGEVTIMAEQEPLDLLEQGLQASSEDDEQQTIACTLDDSARTFWSSKGTADMLSSEWLVYKLRQPVCIVTRVEITPYKARYQRGMPIYAPRYMTMSIGFSPEPENMHFISELFPVENRNVSQSFNIKPTLVVGGYVRLHLHGRYQTQPGDNLYYTVLQSVRCFGIPIGLVADKQSLSLPLMELADVLKCDYTPWYGVKEIVATQRLSRLKTLMLPTVMDRTTHAEALASIQRLLMRGEWKHAADILARTRCTDELRQADFLAWFFESAEAVSEIQSYSMWNEGRAADKGKQPMVEPETAASDWTRIFASVARKIASKKEKENDPVRYYLNRVLEGDDDLTEYEAIRFAEVAIADKQFGEFWDCLIGERFECTEDLGDLFRPHDVSFALSIYSRANVLDKIIDCLLAIGQYYSVIRLIRVTSHEYDFTPIIMQLLATAGIKAAVQFSAILLREDPQLRRTVVWALGVEKETAGLADGEDLAGWLKVWADTKEGSGPSSPSSVGSS